MLHIDMLMYGNYKPLISMQLRENPVTHVNW